MKRILPLAFLAAATTGVQAQRYLTEVFTSAQIVTTSNVPYATNIDFLTSDPTGASVPAEIVELQTAAALGTPYPAAYYDPFDPATSMKIIELKMDIYEPDQGVDTETARPVVVYIHTGNLLPPPINGSPTGLKTDSCAVEVCRRLARQGFVAVSCAYRGGWNPLAPTESERRSQLLNAVYRAIHDVKQCVRGLKADAAAGNSFAIDPTKITLWGEGTGGYIALAYTTLDDPDELYIPKFRPDILDPTVSYVDSNLVGNIHGFGGQLNLYQPSTYSEAINFCVNMGGALADTSWLQAGDAPMVTMHTVRDDFAPFHSGRVVVPVTGEYVVNLQGPNLFIPLANSYGNNDAFFTLPDGDPYTDAARALYGTTWQRLTDSGVDTTITIAPGAEGLYPFIRPLRPFLDNEASPWQWWDPFSPLALVEVAPGVTTHMNSLQSNPDMTPEKGRAYLDTCLGYASPRIVCALDLGPCSLVGINETSATAQGVSITPNPSHGPVVITSTEAMILAYDLYDVNSRLVRSAQVNSQLLTVDNSELKPGAYLIQLHFAEGGLTRKMIIE